MTRRRLVGLALLQLSGLALAGWVATGDPVWVALSTPLVLAGAGLHGVHRRFVSGSVVLLLAGVVGAFVAERHLSELAGEWPNRSRAWETDVQDQLADALDTLLREGEEATAELAASWGSESIPNPPSLPATLGGPGVDALALFGPSGELLAWEGEHQGPVPDPVRFGSSRYLYEEGALFGYLYVTLRLATGETAMAATLLSSDLPTVFDPPAEDFESRFESRTGARIEVTSSDQALEGSIWDLRWEGESLFSVTLVPASEAEARRTVDLAWSRLVTALVLLAGMLAIIGTRGTPAALVLGGAALPMLLLVLPLSDLTGWGTIFSPADVLLPGPLDLTLGDLLALAAAGTVVLGLLPWRRLPSLPAFPTSVVATVLSLLGLTLLESGASRDFLAGGDVGWIVFQGTASGLVMILFGLGATLASDRGDGAVRRLVLAGAFALAFALSAGWARLVATSLDTPGWFALLWSLPLWALARSVPARAEWRTGLLRWTGAVVLAVTAALPWAWELRVEARMAAAEERVERLGTRPDPFLEFLLLRAGEQAAALAEAGREPVEVLYGSWTASGLAMENLPLWITFWSFGGQPREELRIGVADLRPEIDQEMLDAARIEESVVVRRFDLADAHYVAVAPLPRGGFLSIVVPPRRVLAGASPLGPLFSPARAQADPLVLIPLLPGEVPGETEGLRWGPTEDGWQGETFVAYPDEVYRAHYLLELPGWVLLLARGSLILLLNLIVLGILWSVGRWVGQGRTVAVRPWLSALSSFRGRVTLALFAFFLVPSVAFGALAYRTLAGAAVRTAESLAERAAEDAASWYFEVGGAMDVLATRVGSDLLLYENGELVGGSLPELMDLGLYEGWISPPVHRVMAEADALMTTATSRLGGWEYVVAYRRMPGGRVLAAPAPLQAGATALRQRDVADLIGFSLVVGGILSVLLALAVGRALSRPIQTLRIASERVGAGNMSVHLPEERSDEFGAVFDAFNRMVDRLARTRKALLRTSRRTRAIVEEVALGVIALDPEGRVTLANPKVEELLGIELERDRPLDSGLPGEPDPDQEQGPFGALADWVEGYFRDGLREAGTEFSFGERRLRVRARRISRRGPLGGAVITLEDVTDELRAERVLAWGEMAQQVAHEVKNPLTPIKLGVQHIRRAWRDGQPDYGDILERNAEAILSEIERLASIASSFSRYAAPSPAGAHPLEQVDLASVIHDVLDLYAAGGGPVRFRLVAAEPVPSVQGRTGELKEVLVNLLENARAALPSGGEVRVELGRVDSEVELRVVDDGVGIPPEVLGRIFEPHFSTRSSGTGLGLAIVRRLVESWGGRVQAESESGEGTVIRIRLLPWIGNRDSSRTVPAVRVGGGEGSPDA